MVTEMVEVLQEHVLQEGQVALAETTLHIVSTNASNYALAGGMIGISRHTARCTGGAGNPNGGESTGGYNMLLMYLIMKVEMVELFG